MKKYIINKNKKKTSTLENKDSENSEVKDNNNNEVKDNNNEGKDTDIKEEDLLELPKISEEDLKAFTKEDRLKLKEVQMLYIRDYNSDKIEIRLNFLKNLQKRISIEAAILKRHYRLASESVSNNDNKDNTEDTEKSKVTEVIEVSDDDEEPENNSEPLEVLNPGSEDNKPIEYSLVSSDSINEPTNDAVLLSSEGDINMESNSTKIIEGNENTDIVESNDANMNNTEGEGEIETSTKKRKTKTTKAKTTTKKTTRRKKAANDEAMNDSETSEKPKRTRKSAKSEETKTNNNKDKEPEVDNHFAPADKFKRIKTTFDIQELNNLARLYPDEYWKDNADNGEMINFINENYPLEIVQEANIQDYSQIVGIVLSPDGQMLVTFSTIGSAKIWDMETFELIQTLRDTGEKQIDEFFVGRFTPSMEYIVVAGKLKDRNKWSIEDDDNHILPCPLKIFDVVSGQVIARLEGHAEEVLCIKSVVFKNENYYVTTSQDGYIIKWKMKENWIELENFERMNDGITCMAFTISFLPNTGNKYFIAATDGDVSLFDFENAQIIQRFVTPYTHYCDCVKIVDCIEYPKPKYVWGVSDKLPTKESPMFCYFVTRGVEVLDIEDETVPSKPNRCHLEKLIYPVSEHDHFRIEDIKNYNDGDYHSNSWLIKITSNGRYIAAPTYDGKVFLFNLKTGKVSGMLHYHEDVEVRDVIFHPYKPLLLSCSDDGTVKVYRSSKK
jgi:WD40 repeat protein